MLVFVTTNDGTGWISRGGEHLTASVADAKRFDNQAAAVDGVAKLQQLCDNAAVGWEGGEILSTEFCPDNSPERDCRYAHDKMHNLSWAIRAALADLSLAADNEIGEAGKSLGELHAAAKAIGFDVADYDADAERHK